MSDLSSPLPSTSEYAPALEVFVVRPPAPRYWLHGLLMLATIFTTLVVGARMEFNFLHNVPILAAGDEFLPFFPVEWALARPARLLLGVPFSATLLLILLSHEMGHYLYCRHYAVYATLPFFIPAPTLIGTLGAVIRIKSPIRSRAALFDIGIAGPIAGFVVAVCALLPAMSLSRPMRLNMGQPDLELGYPLVFYVIQEALSAISPAASVVSLPLSRISLHPTALAAWVGMYATALNLLPSGQLDGGHIVYALWPRAHRYISWFTVFALVFLAHQNATWRVWAALVAAMNLVTWRQRQAPDLPKIQGRRWALGFLALVMLTLTLTPAPFKIQDRTGERPSVPPHSFVRQTRAPDHSPRY
jgi:membrane-associated protease RseP (regulator of RpoE activity)